VRCPRCECEVEEGARRCATCALPLTIAEEPAPRALDRDIALDRRSPHRLRSPQLTLSLAEDVPVPSSPSSEAASDAICLEDADYLVGAADVGTAPCDDEGASSAPAEPARGRRALAWVIDVAIVALAAVPPLAVARLVAPHGVPLSTMVVPAALLLALLALCYAALTRALMGDTPGGRLAAVVRAEP
jgi:hypothetical protein